MSAQSSDITSTVRPIAVHEPAPEPAPCARLVRSLRLWGAGLGVLCALLAAWALRPLGNTEVSANASTDTSGVVAPGATLAGAVRPALDAGAFDAPLWYEEPRPVEIAAAPPPPPEPPPPPLKYQLLGISGGGVSSEGDSGPGTGGARTATLYCPDTDRVLTVVAGERLGVFTVAGIDAGGVDLADARTTRRLSLALPAAAAGAGGTANSPAGRRAGP